MDQAGVALQPPRNRMVERVGLSAFSTPVAVGLAAEIRAGRAVAGGVRMIFAAAPSQAEMIEALVVEAGIDWRRITAFHMDEYIGLAADAPQRFARWLRERPFSRVPF